MDKKKYQKPTTQVVKLNHASALLVGSTPDNLPVDWND